MLAASKPSRPGIKKVKTNIRIMQSLFTDKKQQQEVRKELKISKNEGIARFKELLERKLIDYDKGESKYWVDYKRLIREYAKEMPNFNDKKTEIVLNYVQIRSSLISNGPLPEDTEIERNFSLFGENHYFFAVVLILGITQDKGNELISEKERIISEYLIMLKALSTQKDLMSTYIKELNPEYSHKAEEITSKMLTLISDEFNKIVDKK